MAYSPLASGYLSGKYRNGAMPKNSRMDLFGSYFPRYKTLNSDKAIDEYWNLAKNFDLKLNQMAIKFCEIQPFVGSVIIGATTLEQLKTNIDSVDINLSEELIKKIGENIKNEVSVTNGYDFKLKAPIQAKSGKKSYDLFSKGRFAWVVDNKDEAKLISTMKKASRLMIIGNTNKGDQTTDHYSMMGFTKAYNTAKKSCS